MNRRTRGIIGACALLAVAIGLSMIVVDLYGRSRWETWQEWNAAIAVVPLAMLFLLTSLALTACRSRRRPRT